MFVPQTQPTFSIIFLPWKYVLFQKGLHFEKLWKSESEPSTKKVKEKIRWANSFEGDGMNFDVVCDGGDNDTEEGLNDDEDTENQSKFLLKDK